MGWSSDVVISEEEFRELARKMRESGFLDELTLFAVANHLKNIIDVMVKRSEEIDNLPPILEFELPKRGVKVVVKVERLEGEGYGSGEPSRLGEGKGEDGEGSET